MKIEINCRFSGAVLLSHDCAGNTIKRTAEVGVRARADLRGADFADADLTGADLRGADFAGASLRGEKLTIAPISIGNMRWPVLITDGYMRIGCKRYTHKEWASFSDELINDMDCDALKFWQAFRGPLLAMCEAHAEKANEYAA